MFTKHNDPKNSKALFSCFLSVNLTWQPRFIIFLSLCGNVNGLPLPSSFFVVSLQSQKVVYLLTFIRVGHRKSIKI